MWFCLVLDIHSLGPLRNLARVQWMSVQLFVDH